MRTFERHPPSMMIWTVVAVAATVSFGLFVGVLCVVAAMVADWLDTY